jgi:hypothetical protein
MMCLIGVVVAPCDAETLTTAICCTVRPPSPVAVAVRAVVVSGRIVIEPLGRLLLTSPMLSIISERTPTVVHLIVTSSPGRTLGGVTTRSSITGATSTVTVAVAVPPGPEAIAV